MTVARALGRYDDSVEDVAQETFLRLLRAGPATDFQSPDALRAYLRMAAVNTTRSHQRRERRERIIVREEPESFAVEATPSMEADHSLWESEAMRAVLSGLEEADRQYVAWLVEGLPLGEIAAKLGISYSAAGVRLHRLRRKLHKIMNDTGLRRAAG
jgi:RNA polymerase sigma-70 factor (ECF subfamily)